jgi:anaerobic magnesium-protoporphyrin IX monomethyl ester cyclase
MRITFIDPEGTLRGLNTGLAYLSSILTKKGHNVEVIDFNNKKENKKKRLEKVKNAEIIGISVKTSTLASTIKISKKIKEINDNALLICGGAHISIDGHHFLENNDIFKIGLIGEAEQSFLEIVSGKPLNEIKGIAYREGKEIITNEKGPFDKNLDNLPFPEYNYFDSFEGTIEKYPILTSRGCPYQCIFCSVGKIIGKLWRFRSAENMVEELIRAKTRYNSKEFLVLDDNFTLNIQRAKEFCRLLIKKKVHMSWSCPNGIRADRLDEELVSLMKRSGCRHISIGVESGSPEVFKKVNKGEKLEDIERAIGLIRKYKIKTEGFFIIGLPGSNVRTVEESMAFAKKIKIDSPIWNILVPYPKTAFWTLIKQDEDVKFLRDWREGFHFGGEPKVVFETPDFTAKERVKMFYTANLKFRRYLALLDHRNSYLQHMTQLIKLIWKYDPLRFFNHMSYISYRFLANKIFNKPF